MTSHVDIEGVDWVAGVAGATRYPTAVNGVGDATNTNSVLMGAGQVRVVGVLVKTMAAVAPAIEIVDHAGTTIGGLTMDGISTTVPFGWIDMPARFRGIATATAGGANIGLKLGAGVTATLFFKRLS